MKHFFLLLLLICNLAHGQQANVTLDIKPSDGQRQVRQDYATIDAAKTAFPNWYARAKGTGWTDAQFLDQSKFVAKWQQLQYFSSPLGTGAPTASTVDVTVPEGNYWLTETIELGRGTYRGTGTFEYHNGNYETTLSVWHEKWRTTTGRRDLVHTSNYGSEGDAGYCESYRFEGFRLDGRAATAILPDPSYYSTAFVGWDNGETSSVDYLYAHAFNNVGLEFVRGTPATGDILTVFNNCQAGIRLTGTAGGTFNYGTISGDDNDILVELVEGFGREAGGQIDIDALKSEAGVTNISRNPHRKQRLLVLRGQFGVNVGVANGSHNAVRVANLIETDCRLKNGTPQISNIVIGSVKGFNYDNTLADLNGGWVAKSPGDFHCYEVHYTSMDRGKMWNPFFAFSGAPGGTNPPPVDPPPTGKPKDVQKYTALGGSTKFDERVPVPAGVNPIASTTLKNIKFKELPPLGTLAWINSAVFIGEDGWLWSVNNGALTKSAVKPTVNTAVNISFPSAGNLTHVIGSNAGSTAVFTGSVEVY